MYVCIYHARFFFQGHPRREKYTQQGVGGGELLNINLFRTKLIGGRPRYWYRVNQNFSTMKKYDRLKISTKLFILILKVNNQRYTLYNCLKSFLFYINPTFFLLLCTKTSPISHPKSPPLPVS